MAEMGLFLMMQSVQEQEEPSLRRNRTNIAPCLSVSHLQLERDFCFMREFDHE